ncbi:mariner Mos1 transposase [Trichonephila clavipes]|nr:mariner Mos1 transposase [Trichonephila clavipes]
MESYDREGGAFLRRIISLDDTWARSYQSKLKHQFNECRHYEPPRRSKFRQNLINVKVMAILVYDCEGVILTHTVPLQQIVNSQYYCHFWSTISDQF